MTNDDLSLREARARYWAENKFGDDGGESLAWVTVKVLGIPFKIPNTESRKKLVRVHDLHHVVTGYGTDLRGEAEIGAWELATGCFRQRTAFALNMMALSIGFMIAPRRMARAWARGRRTRNLYTVPYDDRLLDKPVRVARAELGLDAPRPAAGARDGLTVAFAWLAALPVLLLPLAPLLALVVAWWLV